MARTIGRRRDGAQPGDARRADTAEDDAAPGGPSGAVGPVSRRAFVRRFAGAAAGGAAGVSLLTEALARPAAAATTTESGAVAPTVVVLTDASSIAVDASLGNDFRVTIDGTRAMGDPSNPTDGQKLTFQITQGASGAAGITWGGAYQFSDGLPQPALSTKAGDTDLLGFIYNAAKGKWLLVGYVQGFSSTVVTPPKGAFRLFPSTSGPSQPVSYSGPYMAGVLFQVTTGGVWFDGYWWWVCPSGQATTAQQFALWCVHNDGVGTLIPAASVTSGPLSPGQWNYVKLPQPIPLAIGACYNACTGLTGSFPDTLGQFGGGGPYSAGIVNGPLAAFSDQSGTSPAPFSMSQGVFSVAGSDPTAIMPANGNEADNLWMDLQVETNPPTGTSYRLWPNYPTLPGAATGGPGGYTLATEFKLSQPCTLGSIWFYSAAGAVALPTRCGIWDVSTQTVVSGTDTTSPSWSASAGSGWAGCAYTGITLPAGDYKAAVFYGGDSDWFLFTTGYWAGTGSGAAGIAAGPLTAPGVSDATSPGQSTYHEAGWAYPDVYGTGGNGENYWVDVEVTPT